MVHRCTGAHPLYSFCRWVDIEPLCEMISDENFANAGNMLKEMPKKGGAGETSFVIGLVAPFSHIRSPRTPASRKPMTHRKLSKRHLASCIYSTLLSFSCLELSTPSHL